MTERVMAYQVADSLDLRSLRAALKDSLLYHDSEELFYETGSGRYCYLFRYGVVCFFRYPEEDCRAFLQFLQPYGRNAFPEPISEELQVESAQPGIRISHNSIAVRELNPRMIRLIMLNVSQSVTLDYYSGLSGKLLEETNRHTQWLATRGRPSLTGRRLKKFIGQTLLLKNSIAENLYIFDAPPETWEDEELDKLHTGLKKNFELQDRFRSVAENLAIVKENLELFKDLLQSRYSNLLEWIIILLIAVEVVNFLAEKFF